MMVHSGKHNWWFATCAFQWYVIFPLARKAVTCAKTLSNEVACHLNLHVAFHINFTCDCPIYFILILTLYSFVLMTLFFDFIYDLCTFTLVLQCTGLDAMCAAMIPEPLIDQLFASSWVFPHFPFPCLVSCGFQPHWWSVHFQREWWCKSYCHSQSHLH